MGDYLNLFITQSYFIILERVSVMMLEHFLKQKAHTNFYIIKQYKILVMSGHLL